mmetsp:Transcript_120894/g.341875  ORF Transcript_120894/g.341875 Transcript_120894/m.341875 type:complete len:273 (+) Transcript_120894:238-1056(+)
MPISWGEIYLTTYWQWKSNAYRRCLRATAKETRAKSSLQHMHRWIGSRCNRCLGLGGVRLPSCPSRSCRSRRSCRGTGRLRLLIWIVQFYHCNQIWGRSSGAVGASRLHSTGFLHDREILRHLRRWPHPRLRGLASFLKIDDSFGVRRCGHLLLDIIINAHLNCLLLSGPRIRTRCLANGGIDLVVWVVFEFHLHGGALPFVFPTNSPQLQPVLQRKNSQRLADMLRVLVGLHILVVLLGLAISFPACHADGAPPCTRWKRSAKSTCCESLL